MGGDRPEYITSRPTFPSPNCTLLTKGCSGFTGSILELGNCKKFGEDARLE